ncbi:MAG: sugar phosphate isomerase/epimerase [Lachnospiraceae bacterium]|nr:sugar phosphate isomerase/epimerase [Candidatus Equihabitans merdae]
MKRSQIYISSIASDVRESAKRSGFGIEIAHYCDSTRLDEALPGLKAEAEADAVGIERRTLHAPFIELFPCAIDPLIRQVSWQRYKQAVDLALEHKAHTVIIHAGHNPKIHYPIWFTEQSVPFWKDFAREVPDGMTICLENVLETEPSYMADIIEGVNDPKIQMCLDVGHVNAYSPYTNDEWLERCAPIIKHFHIHNNDAVLDSHQMLAEGIIPMKELLLKAQDMCPQAEYTMEVLEAASSVDWMFEQGLIQE